VIPATGHSGLSLAARPAARWLVLALMLALIAATAIYQYRAIHQELTNVALLRREAVAGLVATVLGEKLAYAVNVGVSLATRVRFTELVVGERWLEAMEIMRDVPADLPLIERLFLADADGTLRADVPALPGVRGENFAHREWFQGVSRNGQPFVSAVYTRAAEPRIDVLAVAVPVRRRDGPVAGILVLQIPIANLMQWIGDIELGSDDLVHVVDSAGRIIDPLDAEHSSPADATQPQLVSRLERGERGVVVEYDPLHGEDAIVAFAPVPAFGWGVAMVEPVRASIAFQARDEQLRTLVTGYVFVALLVLAATFMASRIVVDRRLRGELERRVESRTAELVESKSLLESEIEERKIQQAIVQRYADDIEDLYNNAPCGYHSLDADGLIVRMNDTELTWLGYDRDEIVGVRRFPDLVAEADRDRFRANLECLKDKGEVSEVEYAMIRKDGSSFPASVSSTTLRDGHGRFLASRSILFDISERRRAQTEIRALNEDLTRNALELEAANRELEAFSYSVSHDLRAPLRSIDGFSQALLEDYDDRLDDQGRDFLRRVRAATQRMAELIDDLLQLSRVTRADLTPEAVDLGATAVAVMAALRKAETGRTVDVDIGEGLTAVGDPRLLRILLDNLLGNAWKFTSRTADARIELRRAPSVDGCAVFFVRDNGVGFDPAYLDKLFQPFQRLHGVDEFPGTGIGLATVQRIARRHGGSAWAEGRPGEGATFFFSMLENTERSQ
jgi:PAS domain S-box-containing protein